MHIMPRLLSSVQKHPIHVTIISRSPLTVPIATVLTPAEGVGLEGPRLSAPVALVQTELPVLGGCPTWQAGGSLGYYIDR